MGPRRPHLALDVAAGAESQRGDLSPPGPPGWFTPPGLATGLAPSGEARSGTTGPRKPWGGLSGLRGYSGNRGWWAEESQEV